MTPPLSYQKLLEIIAKLPPEEAGYVLYFLDSNHQKTKRKLEELEKKRRLLDQEIRQLQTTQQILESKPQWKMLAGQLDGEYAHKLREDLKHLNSLLEKMVDKPKVKDSRVEEFHRLVKKLTLKLDVELEPENVVA